MRAAQGATRVRILRNRGATQRCDAPGARRCGELPTENDPIGAPGGQEQKNRQRPARRTSQNASWRPGNHGTVTRGDSSERRCTEMQFPSIGGRKGVLDSLEIRSLDGFRMPAAQVVTHCFLRRITSPPPRMETEPGAAREVPRPPHPTNPIYSLFRQSQQKHGCREFAACTKRFNCADCSYMTSMTNAKRHRS
jgi:hypothetical protein